MPTVVNKVVKYTGGDYTSLADAITAFNARNLVSNDEQWNILLDESASGNLEHTLGAELVISNSNVDSTRYLVIRPNTGKGIADNGSKLTNALRYNASNGAAIKQSTAFVGVKVQAPYTQIIGVQYLCGHFFALPPILEGANTVLRDCVVERHPDHTGGSYQEAAYMAYGSGAKAINCVFIGGAGATNYTSGTIAGTQYAYNCSFIQSSSSPDANNYAMYAVGPSGSSGAFVVKNCLFLGFTNFYWSFGGNTLDTSSDYNATDLSAPTSFGTHSVGSLTASSQVQSMTDGSIDARAKSGGGLAAGTRDATNTSDLDIVGSSRSTSTPTIGAWELASTNPPSAPSGVTASSVTASGASISWTDNSSDETGFKVRYAPSPYSSYTTATGSVAASPYALSGLSDGTSYKAGVAAFNANGDSTWVESGVFTTTALSKLRPNTDTSAGSWSASSGSVLYSMIDEANADDTDYISANSATTCKIKFETSTDPADNSNHSIRIRARSTSGALTIRLVQGHPSETTLVSWAPTLTSSFANYQYDLSTAEASVITDYSALYLKLSSS